MAGGEVVRPRDADGAGRLCHAVALHDRGTKADAQEHHDLVADGGCSCRHELDLPANLGPDLGEHQPVIQLAPAPTHRVTLLKAGLLVGVCTLEKHASNRAAGADGGHDPVVDAIPQARHRHKDLGLEGQHIVQQLLHVAAVEANSTAQVGGHHQVDPLVDVGQGQVADMSVARHPHVNDGTCAGSTGYQVVVRQHRTFGYTSCPACVAQRGNIRGLRRHMCPRVPPAQ
mmetsp:Transcript_35882/g.79891  ORF Transcript_35882/g.79891 Transcript_35882/m.79891 type:complete len:229 (-) Transcript_35882:881-1567(-)